MNMRRAGLVILTLVAASAVVGGLWVWLAPAPNVVVEHGGGARWADESEPAKLFSGLAVFALLSFGLGVFIALGAWFGLRSTRGPAGLSVVAVMSIATSVVSLQIAETWAQAVHGQLSDHAVPGRYHGTVRLWVDTQVGPPWVLLICAPTAAVLVYLVFVISSSHADLGVGGGAAGDGTGNGAAGDGAAGDARAAVQVGAGQSTVTSVDEEPRTRP